MLNRARGPNGQERRRWLTPSAVVAVGVALSVTLFGGSAIAGKLIRAGDIAAGAVTSKSIRNGAIKLRDLNPITRQKLSGANGVKGDTGLTGPAGANGLNGLSGVNGANGPNGANGADGLDGSDGTDGTNGTNGADGLDGIDGTIAPLWATNGLTALPTGPQATTVVSLAVPAGDYVVLAKSQLSHTGAGDSIDCLLKAGGATIDQVSMKTLPALAAIPMSLQAVTTAASPSQLSVECQVMTANGSANFNSLIAIPTG